MSDTKLTSDNDRPFTKVLSRLRASGLRPTKQRLALARLLYDGHSHRHVTAETLHEEAQSIGACVSLATVYNTLHQFTAAGMLREIVVDSCRTYFDTNVSDHHHFFHEKEGRLEDICEGEVSLSCLPEAPEGKVVSRVDVIIRVS